MRPPPRHLDRCRSRSSGWLGGGGRLGRLGVRRQHGFTIVSKDGDFSGRSSLYGAPPKVIWLALGNCSTSEIERRLRGHRDEIETFATEPDTTLLVIEPGHGAGAS